MPSTIRRSRTMPLLALLVALSVADRAAAQSPAAAPEPSPGAAKTAKATFAGGCFWCMEGPFDKLDGVLSTTSGYTGGHVANPTYEQVGSGETGHAESVQVIYDPEKISYEKLLDIFWHNVDPLQANGQFCDHGNQYRSAIFYKDAAQKQAAEASKAKLETEDRFKGKIVTQIVAATPFYRAEEYHQDYYKKSSAQYRFYRYGCGRDARLEEIWKSAAK